jgi:hypothetical protein
MNEFPAGVRLKEFEYGMYRLVPAEPADPGPIDLGIGTLDDLNVVRFHAREQRADGTPFRWTSDQSFVLLLGIAPSATEVTVWMSHGGRPPAGPEPVVEVALDDEPIGAATPEDELRPYTFSIPPALVAAAAASPDPARLRLRVPTWRPAELLGGSDTRDLGVVVTRVEVR